ncbi:MAG: GNAT family N-acetyltransferase [Bacteroidota bacterium]
MDLLLEGEQTKRLMFRKLIPLDFAEWVPFHRDPRSTQYWEGLPKNPEVACQEQFNRTFERYEKGLGGMNALILADTGKLIGLCGLLIQEVDNQKELEIGYSLLPKYWKKGYATEAAIHCRNYAFKHHQADSLISIIHIDNLPSQKVALNIGMYLDKTTRYKDNPVDIYRITAQTFAAMGK